MHLYQLFAFLGDGDAESRKGIGRNLVVSDKTLI